MALRSNSPIFSRSVSLAGVIITLVVSPVARGKRPIPKNSWRGITPLRSTVADVARFVGEDPESFNLDAGNRFTVDGGEVTFSFLSPSLAKIYRAPLSLIGTVFSIHFKPLFPMARSELKLSSGYKKCFEQLSKKYYYLVGDHGLAYQVRRETDQVEIMIYQPAGHEIRRLQVTAECVF